MNKNSNRRGLKAAGWRAFFTAALISLPFASFAEVPVEFRALEHDPVETEHAPQWLGDALQSDGPTAEQLRLDLADEAWEISDAPAGRFSRPVRPEKKWCEGCEFQLGVGGTYHSFEGTRGTVIPLTMTWDRSRWELGVFRFATAQLSADNSEHTDQLIAHPYWGASLSRRFHFFERGPVRAFFGFGVSYKTEQDILSVTHWNFASQLGLRLQAPGLPAIFEISARHWSNGGVETPNRGQDFAMLTVRFDN